MKVLQKKKHPYKLHETNLINLNYPPFYAKKCHIQHTFTAPYHPQELFCLIQVEILSFFSPKNLIRVGQAVVSSNPAAINDRRQMCSAW